MCRSHSTYLVMGRYKRLLSSVYNGFMPVSQIKGSLIVVLGLYLIFLGINLADNFSRQRFVRIENKQDGGVVAVDGIKYPVSYTQVTTLVPVKISNPIEFLFLSSGDMDESVFSAVLKIITGLLLFRLIGQIDLKDPFNPDHYKLVNTITWLMVLIIITAYFKGFYTSNWFKETYRNASGFQYAWSFGPFYLIPLVWLLRAVSVFYRSAVITRQETEFTI